MSHSAPFAQLTGAKVAVKKGEAQVTLSIKKDFHHAAGAMHGALYFLSLDNAAFFAVNSLVEDVFVLTVSLTTYITRPVSEGVVKAIGKAGKHGKKNGIGDGTNFDRWHQPGMDPDSMR